MTEAKTGDDTTRPQTPPIVAGLIAGACAGLLLGASEAVWIAISGDDLREVGILAWGPAVMALLCAPAGAVLALLADRYGVSPQGVAMGALFFASGPTVLRYRALIALKDPLDSGQISKLMIVCTALAAGLVLAAIGGWLASRLRSDRLVIVSLVLAGISVGFGLLASTPRPPRDYSGIRQVETANLSKRNAASESTRPDIILIVADTLRSDFVSSYDPNSFAKTPAIDGLARDGIRFQNYCAQSSWTKPTFATLMTGLHPRTHTATRRTAVLPSEVTTLGEALQDAGYYTVGTSNANPNNSAWANFDQGFVEWYEFAPSNGWWGAPWSATQMIVYQRVIEPLMRTALGFRIRHFYKPGDDVTGWTLAWLRNWKRPANVPLFLSLHYMDPHQPHLAGAQVGPKMRHGWTRAEEGIPPLDTMRAGYAGDIETMDAALARLLEGLRELRFYDDAIVVFTSDHGDELLEHGSWGHGESLYAEQLRVPLVVKLPRAVGAGKAPRAIASQVDLPTTLLTLAGVPAPDAFQGNALLSLGGEVISTGNQTCLASLERNDERIEAIHSRDASLIRHHTGSKAEFTGAEFFDLARDPTQGENIAGRGDPREARLERVLRERLSAAEAARIDRKDVEIEAGLEAQLRALGYVE